MQAKTVCDMQRRVSAAVLLFNSILLFGRQGGFRVLAIGKIMLWFSLLLITVAIVLCVVSTAGSL